MKTSIKNLFVAALTIIALSSVVTVSNASENNLSYTSLTQVKNISKIVVSGNVKLILIQDSKEQVEVYDRYYSNNALVQQQGPELRISSFTKDPLTVVAHINNLSAIEVSNTSSVMTSGKFNLLNLSIVLKDQASASIYANTVNLNTIAGDETSLSLEGTTENHMAVLGNQAKLKMGDFAAGDSNISIAPKALLASSRVSGYGDLQADLLERIF